MRRRFLCITLCVGLLTFVAWLGRASQEKAKTTWTEIAPGVLRSSSPVAGYALVAGDKALLIDAPGPTGDLAKHGVRRIDGVLLTHYHRSVCAGIPDLPKEVKIQAPKKAEEWLAPKAVEKYWRDSIPLRGSRTAYLVLPVGVDNIDYALVDGKTFEWEGWKLSVLDTPGHALAHVAITAQKAKGPRVVFCGGAFASAGKLWAPYTTDWDHWTDAGLKPTAESLRKLITAKADVLCPAHGPVVDKNIDAALKQTLAAVEEIGFLKSFERYTKDRLGNAPQYRFLAKEQAMSNGSKPWTQVSEHIWLTGNTYVLTSKDNVCLMIDPWDKRSADQFAKLQADQKLGPIEVVMFSHAHFDHYDGVHYLPERAKFEVWALDAVAGPIAEPFLLRAPFLDARTVKFDKKPKDGDTLTWREYRFKFSHLPGQSEYTMGVETTIDGKRCYFTADNFFHQDMFSGSGGWMGLNRSFPPRYAASAKKVLDAAPEWVLAEHGGPFEFNAEDWRRRVSWGNVSAKAADLMCPSGNHLHDWNPHGVHFEPLVQKVKPGANFKGTLVVANVLAQRQKVKVTLEGRGLINDETLDFDIPPGTVIRPAVTVTQGERPPLRVGRHVFTLRTVIGAALDPSDAFFVVDVEP
ncbi:MAG: MBL fold metallo-hydrolase [Planctomycetes bacterium]|nr:MBL fold metallo-hydrolase [Planctomycetota bacterium]